MGSPEILQQPKKKKKKYIYTHIKGKWNKAGKQTMQLVRYFAPVPTIPLAQQYRQFDIDKAELQLSGFDRPVW